MKWFNKILIFAYTLLVVFCLTRLAALESNQLAQIVEIILALVTIVKAMKSDSIGFLSENNDTNANNSQSE